ncbi:MAG: ABC transporter ATP-binding protein [Patescibacteria group bacterium]
MDFLTDTSVGEFLDMHLKARGRETEASLIKEVIDEANEITGEPISAKMNLLSLSGGQSRALMVSDIANITVSPIILIDEIENAGIKKSKALQILIEEEKIVLIVTHDPSLALSADKRLVVENGGIVRVLDTAPQEKDIAHYLNWIEEHNLRIREKVRQGEVVEEPGIYCVEPTKFRNIELKN